MPKKYESGAAVSGEEIIGYTVAYEQEELAFPVYVVALLGAAGIAAGVSYSNWALATLGLGPLAAAYYNVPLIETGKPRLGAGQYGLFLDGLGLIDWRAVEGMDIVPSELRGTVWHELHIMLRRPVGEALILDWRQRPLLRRWMRVPWSLVTSKVIRVPLDIFDKPSKEIHATLNRMWGFHRSR